jgi:hypothetical protein
MRRWIVVGVVMVLFATAGAVYAVTRPAGPEKWCAVSADGDQFSTGTQGPCIEVERWARENLGTGDSP